MIYTAQVHLGADDLAAGLSKVRCWLDSHGLAPMTFHYRTGSETVRVRVEFKTLPEASAFAEAFSDVVLGVEDLAQAAE